jgi:hypothetical protein
MVGLLSRPQDGEDEALGPTARENEPNEEAPGAPEEDGGGEMGETEEEGPEANVSPEEQAVYDRFMDQAYKMVYGKERWPTVLRRIQSAPDKVEALATVGSVTALRIATAAKQAGDPISGDVLLAGASELLETLAEDVGKFGVHDYTPDEVEAALYRGMDMFRDAAQQSGLLTAEASGEDMQMLDDANKNGQLGDVFAALQSKSGGRTAPQQGA